MNREYEDFKLNTVVLNHNIINVIHLHEHMIIELTESPSTGYCWYYAMSGPSIIALDEKKTFNFNKPNVIGGSLQIIWKFKCLDYGECKINFAYYKSWKKDSISLDQNTYIVKIVK